jgi:phosphoglycolate phosphatase-like HAD superfamily hydrolase
MPELAAVVADVDAFLLDFDGPVCDLVPAGSTTTIAADARTPLERAGVELPATLAHTDEHLSILGYAATHAPAVLTQVEDAAIAGELEAARTAGITAGAREFLVACAQTDRPVVIVTNNAAAAVEIFLERHELTALISGIACRPYARPSLMKPDPYLAAEALQSLDRPAAGCCMVGDAVTDVEFARAVGVRAIAYAKSERHEARLRPAQPDAVVRTMAELAVTLTGSITGGTPGPGRP